MKKKINKKIVEALIPQGERLIAKEVQQVNKKFADFVDELIENADDHVLYEKSIEELKSDVQKTKTIISNVENKISSSISKSLSNVDKALKQIKLEIDSVGGDTLKLSKESQDKITTLEQYVDSEFDKVYSYIEKVSWGKVSMNNISSTLKVLNGTTTIATNVNTLNFTGTTQTKNPDGSVTVNIAGGGGGTPGGANTNVQFNDAGSFGGNSGFTYNKTTFAVGLTGVLTQTIAGTPTTLTNPTLQATNSVDNYTQISIQNKSATANASADLIAYPDNMVTDTSGFVDIGINSSTYSNATYAITGANDAYLFGSAPSGAGKAGNLVIATDSTGSSNNIIFFTGGFNSLNNERMRVTATGTSFGKVGTSTGTILLNGATSGTTTLQGSAVAGGTITVPNTTGTMTVLGNTTTGSGSIVLATTPTLVTPVLGVATATSINKVTITQPATGSTLTIANGKTLTSSNTLTLTGTDSTTMTFPAVSGNVVTYAVTTEVSNATPTVAISAVNHTHTITALAAGATFAAPTGTFVDGYSLTIRVKDNGTAQTLAWNAVFRASTDLPLPTTTVIGKTLYLGFKWNGTDSKWDLLALLGNI